LRWLSLALPTTWASSAMRSILNRGWSFLDGDVWLGFTVVFAWILYFLHAANKGLRNRD
jgi:ABC-type multidrug transport system permease subunit